MEAISSEVNYFEKPLIQTAIINEFDLAISPLSTIQTGAPIEFEIEAVDELYADLNNSKLEVKLKLTQSDGADLTGAQNVGVVNLMLHSIFSNVVMEIGNKRLSDTNHLYPYRAYLETLINYPKSVLDTRMLCEGWTKDLASQINVTNTTGANTGLTSRSANYATSRQVRLIGRPHIDLFHQEKLIPTIAKMKIILIPNKHPFVLKTAVPGDNQEQHEFKLVISSATLFIHMKQISASLLVAHKKMVQEVNYQIPYTKVLMKHYTIAQGASTVQIDNLFTGVLPHRVTLALVHDQDMNGSYNSNPFRFQHFGLSFIALKVNGEQVPRKALEPNFTTNDYLRDYSVVLEALGYDIGLNTWDLSPSEWAQGYTIYVFRTGPWPTGGARPLPRTGTIGIDLRFRTATTQNINLLQLAEYNSLLELDQYARTIG